MYFSVEKNKEASLNISCFRVRAAKHLYFSVKEEMLRKICPECNEAESKGSGRVGSFSLVIKRYEFLSFDLVDGFALTAIASRNQ